MASSAGARQDIVDARGSARRPAGAVARGATLLCAALCIAPRAEAICTCGADDGQFTLTTITIDGAIGDWSAVRADTDNVSCDPPDDPTSATERGGADGIPDAPQNTGRDLTEFALTWDSTNLYFFTARLGSSNNIQRFIYYADEDRDGLMESGENAIGVEWQGNTRNVTVYRFVYVPRTGDGDDTADPMEDAAGFGDGYDLPGTLTGQTTLRSGNWGSSDGLSMEFRVTWAELGLGGSTAIDFHVSSMNATFNSSNPPNGIEDNMGGCGGGGATTQFAAVDIDPNRSVFGQHATTQCAAHSVTNDGNGNDIFAITNSALPAQAPGVAFYSDNDASGTLTGGDAPLTDVVEPDAFTDITDADTTIDTGVLAAGATRNILVCYTVGDDGNGYSPSGSGAVTVTATSVFNAIVDDSVTDVISVVLVPDLLVVKSSTTHSDPYNGTVNPKRIPGGFVVYTVTVINDGGGAVDADTTVIIDAVPAVMQLYVGDLGGAGSGPVSQSDGVPACALTYSFVSLASAADDLAFSNDGGASYGYTPVPDGNGVDGNVTHIRINPKGSFAGDSAGGPPTCTRTFRARVE